jgi:hypothetical protein
MIDKQRCFYHSMQAYNSAYRSVHIKSHRGMLTKTKRETEIKQKLLNDYFSVEPTKLSGKNRPMIE